MRVAGRGAELGNHDRLVRREFHDAGIHRVEFFAEARALVFIVGRFLCAVAAHRDPLHIVGAGVIVLKAVPVRLGGIRDIQVEHPRDVVGTRRADGVHDVAICRDKPLRAVGLGGIAEPVFPAPAVKFSVPAEPVGVDLGAILGDQRRSERRRRTAPSFQIGIKLAVDDRLERVGFLRLSGCMVPAAEHQADIRNRPVRPDPLHRFDRKFAVGIPVVGKVNPFRLLPDNVLIRLDIAWRDIIFLARNPAGIRPVIEPACGWRGKGLASRRSGGEARGRQQGEARLGHIVNGIIAGFFSPKGTEASKNKDFGDSVFSVQHGSSPVFHRRFTEPLKTEHFRRLPARALVIALRAVLISGP